MGRNKNGARNRNIPVLTKFGEYRTYVTLDGQSGRRTKREGHDHFKKEHRFTGIPYYSETTAMPLPNGNPGNLNSLREPINSSEMRQKYSAKPRPIKPSGEGPFIKPGMKSSRPKWESINTHNDRSNIK